MAAAHKREFWAVLIYVSGRISLVLAFQVSHTFLQFAHSFSQPVDGLVVTMTMVDKFSEEFLQLFSRLILDQGIVA